MYLSNNDIDICLIQESHITSIQDVKTFVQSWGGYAFFSFGSKYSRGVGILIRKKIVCSVVKKHYDFAGRILVADIIADGESFRILSVYAPNGERERKDFISNLDRYLTGNTNIILGGDFNFVENISLDKKGGNDLRGDIGRDEMKTLCQDFGLKDMYRYAYPTTQQFTWSSSNIQCRLDRFYVSNVNNISVIRIENIVRNISDHALVWMDVQIEQSPQGPGYWKLNSKILKEKNFNADFNQFWEGVTTGVKNYNAEWWDDAKLKIKHFLKQKSSFKAHELKQNLKRLKDRLDFYKDCGVVQPGCFEPKIHEVQSQILAIETEILEGAKIRARFHCLTDSEKPSRFFLQKEVQRAKKKSIVSLQKTNGQRVSKIEDLIKECVDFYSCLFQCSQTDRDSQTEFLDQLPRLPEVMAQSLESPITKDECLAALRKMKDNKSPGLDGLTKELYLQVFNIIGDHFLLVINSIYQNKSLSHTQRLGLITLICKSPEHPEHLRNWRPISLLNVDYKIIAKVLSARLSSVLANIIHIDQTCSVPGRSILDNAHLIRNVVDYSAQKQIELALVSLDQSKAFDRVSFDFLFRALERYGFGPNFRSWIKILYSQPTSSILVNQHISSPIRLHRGVRQGCSLSPLLYVCFIESFAIAIRRSALVRGLPLPGVRQELKISQYADDTTCIVRDENSIKNIFNISERFCRASGALLNQDKSKGLLLGGIKVTRSLPIQWQDCIKICGIYFGMDSYNRNWNNILQKIRSSANLHSQRHLTMRGKALIADVMICSKIWYVGSVLPVAENTITLFNKIIFGFLWSNKNEKINRQTLHLPHQQGGLKLVSVSHKLKAFRVKHLLTFLNGDYAKWHCFSEYWIGLKLAKYKVSLHNNSMPHSIDIPNYYKACYSDFQDFVEILTRGPPSAPPPSKRARLNPPGEVAKLRCTKECYKIFQSTIIHIPLVYSKFPQIDFSLSWRTNMLAFLDPFDRNLTWRLIHGVLPVKVKMAGIGMPVSLACPHCNATETLSHAFYECPTIKPLWDHVLGFFNRLGYPRGDFPIYGTEVDKINKIIFNIIRYDGSPSSKLSLILIYTLRFVIWQVRNEVLHERKTYRTINILEKFLNLIKMRIKVDFYRLNLDTFKELWGKNRDLVWERDGKLFLWD